jgi:hypothetical protein
LTPNGIPATFNRFELLDKESEDSRNVEMKEQHIQKQQKANKSHNYVPRRKVIVVGDSHARGCAEELTSHLKHKFQVCGYVKPGANTRAITKSTGVECKEATKKDCIVLWSGANNISKNNTKEGLQHVIEFVKDKVNTNIIAMSAPHRHDLSPSSCVNTEVKTFNRRMKKLM